MDQAQAVLTVDLGAVRHNYQIIKEKIDKNCRIGVVLKANAYGLGAAEIAPTLYAAGARDFFVSSPQEGVALREVIRNCYPDPAGVKKARIYILNGFYNSAADLYAQSDLVPVLGSFAEIEAYKKQAAKQDKKLDAYLSFNTRMNRLGLGSVETEKLLGDMTMLDGIHIIGILSHFACADEKDHPLTETQYDVFNKIAHAFSHAEKSLCNSSGIFRHTKYHYDLVRSGMALYGLNPTPETKNPMRPVISLAAPVVRLRLVYKDASVGYGATYTFEKDTWLATVSAGYADGIFWSLGNKGALYWKGYRCPIRGRVSMDLTTVDLSAVPELMRPRPGDCMEIIGPYQDADMLATDAGTIGYEILTALGSRYRREYVSK